MHACMHACIHTYILTYLRLSSFDEIPSTSALFASCMAERVTKQGCQDEEYGFCSNMLKALPSRAAIVEEEIQSRFLSCGRRGADGSLHQHHIDKTQVIKAVAELGLQREAITVKDLQT